MEYKSVMVWSDGSLMGGITPEHVTKVVQPALDRMSSSGWILHSQGICLSNLVGIHMVFYKE